MQFFDIIEKKQEMIICIVLLGIQKMHLHEIEKLQSNTKKLKLLYVEDNEETRLSAVSLFERFFDDIVIAVDGEDGVDKFNRFKPDIIFTDIDMPKMNGLQMIENINTPASKHTPVLVLSALGESQNLLNAIKIGVDGYLIKPVELESFIEELQRIINKKYIPQKNVVEINEYYRWNKETKKLYYLSEEIRLTKNEILLFELMVSNINLIYSDELIMEQIWFDSHNSSTSNVKNLFKRLNDKLSKKLIKNIYSVGYSFV